MQFNLDEFLMAISFALETANVVLMADDLSKVSYAISLGRRSTRIIKQNIIFDRDKLFM